MKNVLVTGGSGFMGSHFVRHLYTNYPEYKIVNLDLLTYAGNPENLIDIDGKESVKEPQERRYEHVRGDVCDAVLIDKLFQEYDFSFVFHFAAETHVDRSIFNFSDFVRTNVEGTRVILEAARVHRVPKVIHISTDEVYGNVPAGFSTEESPLNPSNLYAASKAAGDMLAHTYAKVYAMPIAIVRSGNNYGPYQYPEKLIPLTITNLIEDRPIPLHGNGMHERSWVHVQDFCFAVDLIAHKGELPEVYNIAGEHKANLQIIEMIAKVLNKDVSDSVVRVHDRPSADMRYAPDASKLEKQLAWRRNYFIEAEISNVVEWYRKNKPWWHAIRAKKEFLDQYEKQSKAQWG
jgi:dTDP-glucose 4,6-dehydratase